MIVCKNLSKTFYKDTPKGLQALKDINITFYKGEFIVLKGASGSGKSTLLSLIAALAKPSHGEVLVEERQISKMPDNFASMYRRENIGFIFQKYNLIPTLSSKDNIILPLTPSNPQANELEEKVDSVLKLLNMSDKKELHVKELSGGEQQRIAIARALINEPNIIIADEPTANLDAKLSLDFIKIMKELKDTNKTIIIATHDPLFFELDFVDRVIELQNGKIICS